MDSSGIANPTASPFQTTTYTVTLTDSLCSNSGFVTVFIDTTDSAYCAVPQNLFVTNNSLSSVNLHWTGTAKAVSYEIFGRLLGTAITFTAPVNGGQTSYTLNGLNPNSTFEWQVRSICDTSGPQPAVFSEPDTFLVKENFACAIPDSVLVGLITKSSAKLFWTPVPAALGYQVQGRPVGAPGIVTLTIPGQNSFKQVSGLQSLTAYEWRVRAICDPGFVYTSDYTPIDTFMTLAPRLAGENVIGSVDQQNEFLIFPNPGSGEFYLVSHGAAEKYAVRIFNSIGQIVYQTEVDASDQSTSIIDISDRDDGLYYCEISTEKGVVVREVDQALRQYFPCPKRLMCVSLEMLRSMRIVCSLVVFLFIGQQNVFCQFQLDSTSIDTSVIAKNLDTPWEIYWGPDNWIWVSERPGIISRINPQTGERKILLDIRTRDPCRRCGRIAGHDLTSQFCRFSICLFGSLLSRRHIARPPAIGAL